MKFVAGGVAAVVVLAVSSGAASAADVVPVTVPAVVTPVVVPPAPGFDWGGFYVGAGAGFAIFDPYGPEYHLIAYAGANVPIGARIVAGAEAYLSGWFSPEADPGLYLRFGAETRVGFLVRPSILPYAAVGIAQYYLSGGNRYLTIGAGAEFALGRALSLDIAYDFERALNTAATGHRLTASINFHFGN